MVVDADEVQHRSALGQVQLAGTCCWESISYASVRAGPKMSPCHVAPVRALVFLQTSLDIDGLVHQGGEIGNVMH